MPSSPLTIRPLTPADIPTVTAWAQQEGFAPGAGDVAIYRQTDRQGLWVGWLDGEPVGCSPACATTLPTASSACFWWCRSTEETATAWRSGAMPWST